MAFKQELYSGDTPSQESLHLKKPKRREWFTGKEQMKMRHMTRERILWTDITTHTGKWMRVVNMHQETSKDKVLQEVVLRTMECQLGQHENLMGIM